MDPEIIELHLNEADDMGLHRGSVQASVPQDESYLPTVGYTGRCGGYVDER